MPSWRSPRAPASMRVKAMVLLGGTGEADRMAKRRERTKEIACMNFIVGCL